ncbi:hypothetical protein HDU97_000135 [Phlyctochytrium planicorne]|nr:hypothetical protein HDU97_000135 [Phlyctochytrium planicorne]
MDALVHSLVPKLLGHACNNDTGTVLNVPSCYETIGSCVILDLSGYTKLSEILFAGSDNDGGERLFKTINPFFGAIINTFHRYGGDIIKFCGDSIIVCWSQTKEETQQNQNNLNFSIIQRTVLCVVEIMQNYDGYKVELPNKPAEAYTSGKETRGEPNFYELGVHIGLGFGPIVHVFVGQQAESGRSEYLVVGGAVTEASTMLKKTKRGQVAMSFDAWSAFQQNRMYPVRPKETPDDEGEGASILFSKASSELMSVAYKIKMEMDPPDYLDISIQRPIKSFLDESTASENLSFDLLHYRFSELRKITSVFLQINDFDCNKPAWEIVNFIQRLFEVVNQHLNSYKGRLRQIVLDDKGLTVLCVWGLPPTSSRDHLLALFCAIAMRDAIRRIGFGDFSIGIASGITFTGVIGNSIRSDFNLFGRSLNIAARCMALPMAVNSIACDHKSFDPSDLETGGIKLRDARSMNLKGIKHSLEIAILESGSRDPFRATFENTQNPESEPVTEEKFDDEKQREDGDGGMLSFRGKIVGRDQEIAEVEDWVKLFLASGKRQRGLIVLGKSGCGKSSLGKLCEEILETEKGRKEVIFSKTDCFEIAQHSGFYVEKALISQVLAQLMKKKDEIASSANRIQLYIDSQLQQKVGLKAPVAGMRRQSIAPPPIQSQEEFRTNNTLTANRYESRPSIMSSSVNLGSRENNLSHSEIGELLKLLGFSKQMLGDGVFDDFLRFLGVAGFEHCNDITHNPVAIRNILRHLGKVLTECLNIKCVFMIDNCQWCDVRTMAEVNFLIQSDIPDILVILFCRPMYEIKVEGLLQDLKAISKYETVLSVQLSELDRHSTGKVASKILGCRLDQNLIDEIHTNSGGIPMIVEILTASLSVRKVLRVEGETARLMDGVTLLSDEKNVGWMISSQFDELPSNFQLLLKVASIEGFNFSLENVVQICNDILREQNLSTNSLITKQDALAMILEADKFDFLIHSGTDSEDDIYSFRHIYIQKGIQSLVITDLKRKVHLYVFLYVDHSIWTQQSLLSKLDLPSSVGISTSLAFVSFGVPILEALYHLQNCSDFLEDFITRYAKNLNPALEVKRLRLDYLLHASRFYYEHHVYQKAISLLTELLDSWNNIKLNGDQEDKSLLPAIYIHAQSYSMLSYSYWATSKFTESYDNSMEGLILLKVNVPNGKGLGKFIVISLFKAISYHGEMRRFVRRFRNSKGVLHMLADFSNADQEADLLQDLLSLNLSVGLFSRPSPQVFGMAMRSLVESKNAFVGSINHQRVKTSLLGEFFRSLFGMAHTAHSVAMLCVEFAEAFINLDCYTGQGIQEMLSDNAEETHECEFQAEAREIRRIPILFDVIGDPPLMFSLDMVNFMLLMAQVARMRDFLELQAKYYRLAFKILRELKLQSSFSSLTALVYYREIMYFSGNASLTFRYLDPILDGSLGVKGFRQYSWADAVLYAVESMDFDRAAQREQEFYQIIGEPDATLPVDEKLSDGAAGNKPQDVPGAAENKLPPILERDITINFLFARIAKLAVASDSYLDKVIGILKSDKVSKENVGPQGLAFKSVSYDFENQRKSIAFLGKHLINTAEKLDKLLVEPVVFFPAMKCILMTRSATLWRMWDIYANLKAEWICLALNHSKSVSRAEVNSMNPWNSPLAVKYGKKWANVSMKAAIKIMHSPTSPHLRPWLQGSIACARGDLKSAERHWKHALQLICDIEAGKEVTKKDRVGDFEEPPEWSGIRFYQLYKKYIIHRFTMSEALQLLADIVKKRRGANRRWSSRKVSPLDRGNVAQNFEIERMITMLMGVRQSLEKQPFARLELLLLDSVMNQKAIFGLVASPNGNVIFDSTGRTVMVPALEDVLTWDVRTGEKTGLWSDEDNRAEVTCIAKSPNQRDVAVGYSDGSIRLWKPSNNTITTVFSGHKTAVTVLTFDRLGERLASGSRDTDLVVWDVLAETGLYRLRGHRDQITGLRFLETPPSDFGKCDHLVSTSKDTMMKFWDLKTQHCVETVVAHRGEAWALELVPQAAPEPVSEKRKKDEDDAEETATRLTFTLVTGGVDGDVKVWSVDAAILALKLEPSAALSDPKASMEIDGEDDQSSVDPSLRKAVKLRGTIEKQFKDRIVTITAHPSGKFLGVQGNDRYVELYKIRSEAELRRRLARLKKRQREKKKSKKSAAAADDQDTTIPEITVLDLIPRFGAIRCSAKVRSFDFSPFVPNKQSSSSDKVSFHVVCGLSNNQLEMHLVQPEKEVEEGEDGGPARHEVSIDAAGHRTDVRTVSLSTDDLTLLTASQDSVKIWTVETMQCISTIPFTEARYALCSTFVPGNGYAVVGTKEGTLELLDLGAGEKLESIEAHSGAVWTCQIWPDRRGITTGGGDKEVKFWEFGLAEDGKKKRLTLTHTRTLRLTDDVLAVAHSHSSPVLAVSLLDSTVKVFHMETLKFLLSLYGHKLPVLAMDISSDGTLIATASADKTVKIWGLDFGDCHRSLRAHEGAVMGCKFVFGTHYLVSGGKDGLVKFWDADKFEQIQVLKGHHSEIWSLAVAKYGIFLVTASHDKSIRIWSKTEEQFTLEEERERDLEEIHERALIDTAQDDRERGIGDGVDEDEPGRGGEVEVGKAQRTTSESLKAGEKILAALEVWEEEKEGDRAYEAELDRWGRLPSSMRSGKPPQRQPRGPYILATMSGKGLDGKEDVAELYVLNVVESIRSAELEQGLMVLAFERILKLLEIIAVWTKKEWNPTLTSRLLQSILNSHHAQLCTTRSVRLILAEIRRDLRRTLKEQRERMGFNLAGLEYLRAQWEAEHVGAVALAGGDVEDEEKKDGKSKKRKSRVVVKSG